MFITPPLLKTVQTTLTKRVGLRATLSLKSFLKAQSEESSSLEKSLKCLKSARTVKAMNVILKINLFLILITTLTSCSQAPKICRTESCTLKEFSSSGISIPAFSSMSDCCDDFKSTSRTNNSDPPSDRRVNVSFNDGSNVVSFPIQWTENGSNEPIILEIATPIRASILGREYLIPTIKCGSTLKLNYECGYSHPDGVTWEVVSTVKLVCSKESCNSNQISEKTETESPQEELIYFESNEEYARYKYLNSLVEFTEGVNFYND